MLFMLILHSLDRKGFKIQWQVGLGPHFRIPENKISAKSYYSALGIDGEGRGESLESPSSCFFFSSPDLC